MKKVIATTAAPGAIGPYSQAIDTGTFVYASGQIPLDPATGNIPEGITAQTTQSLANVCAILEAAGPICRQRCKDNRVPCRHGDFAAMNEVYGKFSPSPYPARSAVVVRGAPPKV